MSLSVERVHSLYVRAVDEYSQNGDCWFEEGDEEFDVEVSSEELGDGHKIVTATLWFPEWIVLGRWYAKEERDA